jgi:hypothetical protein
MLLLAILYFFLDKVFGDSLSLEFSPFNKGFLVFRFPMLLTIVKEVTALP